MLAAGLDGINQKMECREDLNNINIYHLTLDERNSMGIDSLPGSLPEALRELEKDPVLIDSLGREMFETFTRAKWAEVEEYRLMVSDWELERYLEVA